MHFMQQGAVFHQKLLCLIIALFAGFLWNAMLCVGHTSSSCTDLVNN